MVDQEAARRYPKYKEDLFFPTTNMEGVCDPPRRFSASSTASFRPLLPRKENRYREGASASVVNLQSFIAILVLAHKGFFSPLDKREFRKGQLQSIPHPTMQNHDLLCSLVDGCWCVKGEIMSVGKKENGKMVTPNS